jgi:hypothetical protein
MLRWRKISLVNRKANSSSRQKIGRRLQVESLEERTVPVVTNLGAVAPGQFVSSLYADVLHRQPQAAESEIWSLSLDNGASTGQLVRGFIDSREYRTNLIDQTYQKYLHRNPEPGAASFWIGHMQSGLSYQGFLVDVLSSKEYIADHGGGSTWITGLYSDLLNRKPDVAGLTFWQTMLPRESAVAVAQGFVYSAQFDASLVTAAYQQFLGRNPDPTGAVYWRQQLQQGLSSEQLSVLLASSSEAVQSAINISSPAYYGSAPASTSVQLITPYFSSVSTPTIAVNAIPTNYSGPVWIDVDLNHDGSFTDPGDTAQSSGQITSQSNQVTLNGLANGTYSIRARILGPNNTILVSPTATIYVNTDQGFVGSSLLNKLYSDYSTTMRTQGGLSAGFFSPRLHPENFDAQHRVGINVHVTGLQFLGGMASDLENLGMAVSQIDAAQGMVIGYAPLNVLGEITTLPNFSSVTPIYAPVTFLGPDVNEGAALIKANQFQAQQGANGAGQTVGIVSDSINALGNLPLSQSQGVVPGNLITNGTITKPNLQILEDGPAGATDEGRAMAEIVHATAPGANILFSSGDFSPQDMALGIQLLGAAGATQIVDDIGYADEPMFNDGVIAQAVDYVNGHRIFYASAAGNDGNSAFMTSWKSTTATVGGMTGTFLDLGGGNPLQTFTLDPVTVTHNPFQSFIKLDTQWDNAFLEGGSIFPKFQVNTQINVYITTADGSQILGLNQFYVNDNTLNTGEAFQLTPFFNDGSFGTSHFAVAFQLVQGPAPTMLRWVNFADTGIDIHALHEGGPAIFGHTVAAGAVAVGAVPWFAPTQPEFFSSVGGGIPILFDQFGNRFSTGQFRVKPDVAGPDGITLSIPLDGSPQFFGTSAAAPHVAAAAALISQRFPNLGPDQVLSLLEANAISVPAGSGRNGLTGFGLIQLAPLTATSPGGGGTGTGTGVPPSGGSSPVTNIAAWGQSSDQATNLGVLNLGTESFASAIVKQSNGLDGNQWGTWTAGASGTFSARLDYSIPGGDLNFKLFVLGGQNTLEQLAAGTLLDVSQQTLSAPVTAGEKLYLWIYGFNHSQGNYNLTVTLS